MTTKKPNIWHTQRGWLTFKEWHLFLSACYMPGVTVVYFRSLSWVKCWYLTCIMTILRYVSVIFQRQLCVVFFLRLGWNCLVLRSINHNSYFGNFLRIMFLAPAFFFLLTPVPHLRLLVSLRVGSPWRHMHRYTGWKFKHSPDETSAHKIWSHFPKLFE